MKNLICSVESELSRVAEKAGLRLSVGMVWAAILALKEASDILTQAGDSRLDDESKLNSLQKALSEVTQSRSELQGNLEWQSLLHADEFIKCAPKLMELLGGVELSANDALSLSLAEPDSGASPSFGRLAQSLAKALLWQGESYRHLTLWECGSAGALLWELAQDRGYTCQILERNAQTLAGVKCLAGVLGVKIEAHLAGEVESCADQKSLVIAECRRAGSDERKRERLYLTGKRSEGEYKKLRRAWESCGQGGLIAHFAADRLGSAQREWVQLRRELCTKQCRLALFTEAGFTRRGSALRMVTLLYLGDQNGEGLEIYSGDNWYERRGGSWIWELKWQAEKQIARAFSAKDYSRLITWEQLESSEVCSFDEKDYGEAAVGKTSGAEDGTGSSALAVGGGSTAGYERVKLGDLIYEPQRGLDFRRGMAERYVRAREPVKDSGWYLLQPGNVSEEGLLDNELAVLDEALSGVSDLSRYQLYPGELALSRNGSVPRVGVTSFPEETKVIIHGNLLKLMVKPQVNALYLAAWLNSEQGRQALMRCTSGATMQVIRVELLKKLEIPLPGESEQQKIANKYSELLEDLRRIRESEAEKIRLIRGIMGEKM